MKCLREIVGVTLWDKRRNVDILEKTGELPVEEQLHHKWLQWFGHLQRVPENRPQKQALRCRPHGRKWKPGGTLQRWVDLIHKDLSNLQWSEHVKNRSQWRSVIHQPHLPAS